MNVFRIFSFCALSGCLIAACQPTVVHSRDKSKQEITDAESAFQKMAAEKGLQAAFTFYADSNAVIKRGNDSLIFGKTGIAQFYGKSRYRSVSLTWAPDFIDVSDAGDLAYTYGKYLFQPTDSSGKKSEYRGVFHTVWKRQKNGEWRFVWD